MFSRFLFLQVRLPARIIHATVPTRACAARSARRRRGYF